MQTHGWLLVDILEEKDGLLKIESELIDGSKFTIAVRKYLVTEISSANPQKRGWLAVDFFGQRDNQVSITLPQPILNHGHKVVVDVSRINLKLR